MEAFKNILHEAQRIVVLTGAGMSTESGIPDFRSAGGIWTEDASRMEAMSLDYFSSHPRLFWPKFKELFQMKMSGSFESNEGHLLLAELEKQGKQVDIFTQNIDGLHKKRGTGMYTNCMVLSRQQLVRHAAPDMIFPICWSGRCRSARRPETMGTFAERY